MSILPIKANKIISLDEVYSFIAENKNISKPIMTKYELDQIIGHRATMLANGSPAFINTDNLKISSNMELRKIAIEELLQGRLPLIISRPMPNNKCEYIRIKDLDLVSVQNMLKRD
tara:strand:+ start:622 stop:969 length:348 start_codon:yes stop_codon:yes gene_type:complete